MKQIEFKEMRCQSLKVKTLPNDVESYYNDLQEDYQKLLTFCIENSGHSYTKEKDGEFIVIEPNKIINKEVKQWVNIIEKGGQKAESCYGVLYNKYKPKTKPKANSKYAIFVNGKDRTLPFHLLPQEEFDKKIKSLDLLTEIEWNIFKVKAINGEKVWNEVAQKVGNPNKGANLAIKVRNYLPKIRHNEDKDYCTALMNMVSSSFSSWRKCHELHQEETNKLKESLDKSKKELGRIFDTLLGFSDNLDKLNYGLTKKVLKKMIEFSKGKVLDEFWSIPCNEWQKDEYTSLRDSDEKLLYKTYNAIRLHWKLLKRKKYISFPKMNDYQVPFGLTGRGKKFKLEVNDNNLVVKIDGMKEGFTCCYSNYFDAISFISFISFIKNKGYKIKFRHKLKDNKKEIYGDWIEGQLNEIKLLKKNNEFFVYLPYTIEHDNTNKYLEKFF